MEKVLLGGKGHTPATDEEKAWFKDNVHRVMSMNQEELAKLQRIEWGLTKGEYIYLKWGR